MTNETEKEICECGHKKNRHIDRGKLGHCKKSLGRAVRTTCSCKKFKPQNQSQDSSHLEERQDAVNPDALQGNSLSDAVQNRKKPKPVYNIQYTYAEEDVKEAIKKLKEEIGSLGFTLFNYIDNYEDACKKFEEIFPLINTIFGRRLTE